MTATRSATLGFTATILLLAAGAAHAASRENSGNAFVPEPPKTADASTASAQSSAPKAIPPKLKAHLARGEAKKTVGSAEPKAAAMAQAGKDHTQPQVVADNKPKESTPAPTPNAQPAVPPAAANDGPHEAPAPTLADLVSRHAKENGVPPALASAVVRIESNFNPKAKGGSALGLMQIKYQTARSMGFSGAAAALLLPETNLRFGMKVLADAYKASHGDVCMTLARYQSGHLVKRMSAANRSYCSRARTFMAKV